MAQLNLGKVALTYDDLTESQKDELRGEQGFRGEPGTQYGTCSTASSTVAKVVTITDFELKEGVTVMVNFTNANTADNPTLNVSSTGDLAIMNGTEAVDKDLIEAGKIYSFTYNGANWQITSSAGGDIAKPVTQNEYDALSEEEKNKGIYVITDANAEGVASNVGYSNTTSGLTATDVQGAIDEVDGKIDTIESEVDTLQTDVQTINSNLSELKIEKIDGNGKIKSYKITNTDDIYVPYSDLENSPYPKFFILSVSVWNQNTTSASIGVLRYVVNIERAVFMLINNNNVTITFDDENSRICFNFNGGSYTSLTIFDI